MAASAERCGVAVSTAFRWRHRFLRAAKNPTRLLSGIVEVDETYILSSCKGERRLGRKARRRGGKAAKRGLSDEQTPILVAADRSGATISAVLSAVTAQTIKPVLAPILGKDTLLSPTAITSTRLAPPPSASAMKRSTSRKVNASAANYTSRPSTVAMRASKPSCAPVAALPQNTSTATSGGSTSPASSTIPRPEHASMPPSAEEPK